jgi:uncharacterized Zn-binding protein involved in type VI secretion
MKTLSTALGLVLALAASIAAAATLGLGSTSLAAGSASVTSCGVSSLVATRDVDNAGNVTQVSVGGIPAACAGETLSVALVGTSASASTTISGTSATFTGFGPVPASSVTGFAFAVEGA